MGNPGTYTIDPARERWIALSVASASTVALFLALPILNRAVTPHREDMVLREIDAFRLPSRVSRPIVNEVRPDSEPRKIPAPEIVTPSPLPLRVELPLVPDMSGVAISAFTPGVQSVSFGLSEEGGGAWGLEDIDRIPEPLARLEPMYPARARLRRIEGSVLLQFIVDADGATTGIEVVSSDPPGVFDTAAAGAIERWRFRPGMKDGQAVPVRVRQRMTFKLEDGE